MSSIFVADRAQLIIAGINLQPNFNVGQGNLVSISVRDLVAVKPIRAINYTPSPIAPLIQTIDVQVMFRYMYTNEDQLFDFSTLPYQLTPIQLQLININGGLVALIGGLYYRSSDIEYSRIGVPVFRTISLGAFSIDYLNV